MQVIIDGQRSKIIKIIQEIQDYLLLVWRQWCMKYFKRFICNSRLAALVCCVVSLGSGYALCATTAPVVTVLPVFKEGSVTPTRMTQDSLNRPHRRYVP